MRPILVALALLLLAACGDEGGVANEAGASPPPPMSSVPPPALDQPAKPPKEPSDQFKPIVVRGTIQPAAGPDCIEMDANGIRYALVGKLTQPLKPGDEVEVMAIAAPQRVLPCDGAVLNVREVRRI